MGPVRQGWFGGRYHGVLPGVLGNISGFNNRAPVGRIQAIPGRVEIARSMGFLDTPAHMANPGIRFENNIYSLSARTESSTHGALGVALTDPLLNEARGDVSLARHIGQDARINRSITTNDANGNRIRSLLMVEPAVADQNGVPGHAERIVMRIETTPPAPPQGGAQPATTYQVRYIDSSREPQSFQSVKNAINNDQDSVLAAGDLAAEFTRLSGLGVTEMNIVGQNGQPLVQPVPFAFNHTVDQNFRDSWNIHSVDYTRENQQEKLVHGTKATANGTATGTRGTDGFVSKMTEATREGDTLRGQEPGVVRKRLDEYKKSNDRRQKVYTSIAQSLSSIGKAVDAAQQEKSRKTSANANLASAENSQLQATMKSLLEFMQQIVSNEGSNISTLMQTLTSFMKTALDATISAQSRR